MREEKPLPNDPWPADFKAAVREMLTRIGCAPENEQLSCGVVAEFLPRLNETAP